MAARPDKRRTPRIQPFVASCRVVEGSRRLPGYLTDLSIAGARVTSEREPPAPGTRVVLEVRFRRQIAHSRVSAEIKWARAGSDGFACGLTFSGASEAERRVLEGVVEEFRRRAAELA